MLVGAIPEIVPSEDLLSTTILTGKSQAYVGACHHVPGGRGA